MRVWGQFRLKLADIQMQLDTFRFANQNQPHPEERSEAKCLEGSGGGIRHFNNVDR